MSLVRAKAAVPIAGQPLVTRILRWVAQHDVRDLVLNLHHLPETITRYVGDGSDLGVRVRYSWESPVLGSAGGPRKALSLLPADDFFIINGDTLTDVDLRALAAAHRSSGALVTMALVENRWPGRYGGVITDARGIVHGFVPSKSAAASYHFIGVQMVHPSVFRDLPSDVPAESVGVLYRTLIAERPGAIRGFLSAAQFLDVGTPSDYLEVALSVGMSEGQPRVQTGVRPRIGRSSHLADTVIWDDVEIGTGASLVRCIVADGVRIPDGEQFQDAAIIQQRGELVVKDISHG